MNLLQPLTSLLPPTLRTLLEPARGAEVGPQERRLACLLEIPVGELAAVRLGPRYHYRRFTVAKRDGRERRILAPSPALKALQRRLLGKYQGTLRAHPAATAFHPGASIVANARLHAGRAVVATVDLADFFESTSAARVRAFFVRRGWSGAALGVRMRLCVYEGALPQGAPTSPCLSNLVNVELDESLSALARRSGGRYTRYGDDLTFSWDAEPPARFEGAVTAALQAAGYAIQPRKPWRVWHVTEEPEVTGLVLGADGEVRAPVTLHRKVTWLRWLAWWTQDTRAAARLQGYEAYLKMLRR